MENEITLKEFSEICGYLLDRNKELINTGQSPIALGLEGGSGIGKTTIVETIAAQRNMTYCQLNLAQMEEVGDLTGMPIKEVWITAKDATGNTVGKWYPESMVSTLSPYVKVTGKIRTGYAKPAWLPTEENPNGTILFLDDYTRANALFMNACMELINKGKYISWELPKNTNIVLSTNPDDGQFSVTSLDNAQKTRFVNFQIKSDTKGWAEWAENTGIDGRCINFALLYGNEIFEKKNNVQIANPRSYTTFCKAIAGIKDWGDSNNLAMITTISKGCFLDDTDNSVGRMFANFIYNKLDKLVQPEDMLKQKWETVCPKILACNYNGTEYKAEIAVILATRLLNYSLWFLKQQGTKSEVVSNRILEIVEHSQAVFQEDHLFYIINQLVAKESIKTQKLLTNAKIRTKLLI